MGYIATHPYARDLRDKKRQSLPKLKLTDIAVRSLQGSENVTYWDTATPGFGIRVGKHAKTWTIMRGENRQRVSVGRYPETSLSEARAKAKRLLVAEADDTRRILFTDARDEFLEVHYKGSTSDWPMIVRLTLKKHFKKFDHLYLSDITDRDISKALNVIAGPSAKLHAFRALRTFLTWTTKPPRRYLKFSPMTGYPAPGTDRKGTRILTDDELQAVWNASELRSRAIFRLLILWGTRSGETRRLERFWVSGDTLTIPGEATKNGRAHGIPLLPLAESVLDNCAGGPFYFPGREGPLQTGSLQVIRRAIQEETGTKDWQVRDIRRTFRSNMARLRVPREVCEVLINHAPPVLDEIYDRYDRLDEKREALAKYETFMLGLLAQGKT